MSLLRWIAIVLTMTLFVNTAWAAHTLDTNARYPTTANTTNNANPVQTTYTCGAGSTVLVIGLAYAGGTARGGGAPTYNGLTMTQANTTQKAATGPEESVEAWYLLSPPTGSSYTLSVPNSGGLATKVYIATFKAAAGNASALDVTNGCNATGTNPTCSVTTTVNGDAIFAIVGDGAQTWAGTPNQTGFYAAEDLGAWGASAQYMLQGTFGTQAMSWTFGTSEDWAEVVASFKEVTVANGTAALAGTAAASAGGDLAVVGGAAATASLSGSAATSTGGDLAATGGVSATAALSGLESTVAGGDLTVTGGPVDGTVLLAGSAATAAGGSLVVMASANISLTGSGATSARGTLGVSGGIPPNVQQTLQGGGLGDQSSPMGGFW